jgi:hypothetical protein
LPRAGRPTITITCPTQPKKRRKKNNKNILSSLHSAPAIIQAATADYYPLITVKETVSQKSL